MENADIETSSDSYATRFSSPTGQWLLQTQTVLLLELLRDLPGATVLDVGGGHAQSALPLVEAGYKVTVLGSDPVCAQRLRPLIDAGRVSFVSGSLTELPYPDQSFDVAVSFRLVPHCEQWQQLIRELCRVARKSVVVDYPSYESVNCIAGMFFERKKKLEGNTRTWLTFRNREIRAAFNENGWTDLSLRKQFFWPMALHRMMGKPGVSKGLEAMTAMVGLRKMLGSPVIVQARQPSPVP